MSPGLEDFLGNLVSFRPIGLANTKLAEFNSKPIIMK